MKLTFSSSPLDRPPRPRFFLIFSQSRPAAVCLPVKVKHVAYEHRNCYPPPPSQEEHNQVYPPINVLSSAVNDLFC
ncbi:hypothetical protein L2E82_31058 [Cichorium intybus]|uniref:Uncharacterized protein n=1 Tax=Cichorium intybus TaxID=13427 RepID=A0ACB9D280_CICIN|nr:hypothetical protein L2E82_31058 [Cichorium intybus]